MSMEREMDAMIRDANTPEWNEEENGQDRVGVDPNLRLRDASFVDSADIDFRIESNSSPAVLTMSQVPDPEYECPVHGRVSEVITFTLDNEEETYCIRCWRDWFRDVGRIPRINRINNN